MAGHSKWANIKHRKGAQDAKRGKIFQKLAKEIVIAAKKGGDPQNNPSLRLAMAKARSSNMPKDRVDAAIKKGTGSSKDESNFQELIYETNGPEGSFMIIEAATDKPSRTGPHLRSILKKYGWSIIPPNSAMYSFQRQGRIIIDKELISIDKMEEIVLETCASDFQIEDEVYLIYSEPNKLNTLQEELEKHNLNDHLEIGVGFFPNVTVNLSEKHLESLEKLIDLLEDEEDILNIFHNVDKKH